MKIVIDIDEDAYKEIKKIVADGNEMCFMQKLIANGTPLPKGHGRLIDADKFQTDYYFERRYGYDFYRDFQSRVKSQLTIVEADKEN